MKRSKPPKKVRAYEVFYPWLGMRSNVCCFTATKAEAGIVLKYIEQDEHRGQDDRETKPLTLTFPGGDRFFVGYVGADVPEGGFANSESLKVWRPTSVLQLPPANILVDNVSYEREHPTDGPFLISRKAAFAQAAEENAATLQVLPQKPARLNWAIVAEAGEAERMFSHSELCGSLGRLDCHVHHPIRLKGCLNMEEMPGEDDSTLLALLTEFRKVGDEDQRHDDLP